jgi:hypothetical protein
MNLCPIAQAADVTIPVTWVFTNESREDARRLAPREIGCVEHIAFNVSRATFLQLPARLRERGIDFIQRDRGFMDSISLQDPNGLKVALAWYKFETPQGCTAVGVLMMAHALRVECGDHHLTDEPSPTRLNRCWPRGRGSLNRSAPRSSDPHASPASSGSACRRGW